MTPKTCLRCDWQGKTDERSCPSCGAQPLYVVGVSPSGGAGMQESGHPEERSREAPSTASTAPVRHPDPTVEPPPSPTDAVEPSGRSARSAVAFVVAALVLTVTLGTWLKASGEPSTPAAAIDSAVLETPASDGSPTPATSPEPTPRSASEPFFLDLRTGEKTPLAEDLAGGHSFAASLDGSRLAYVETGEEGSPQIFIARIDGTGVRQVSHDPTGAAWPALSPDGTMIAYVGNGSGLYVLDVATSESKRITDGVLDGTGLQFAPDGLSLVYTGIPGDMRTVPVAGGQSTILFGGGRGGMGGAGGGSMSPDGSLATMTGHEVNGPGAAVFVSNADGTQRRSIAGYGTNPAGTWSPDGSQIVCRTYGGRRRIQVVDIATGEAARVADGSGAIWLDDHTLLVEA